VRDRRKEEEPREQIRGDEIVFVDGDASVVPAVYRDNYAQEIIQSVSN
jgi:hypothetical protein